MLFTISLYIAMVLMRPLQTKIMSHNFYLAGTPQQMNKASFDDWAHDETFSFVSNSSLQCIYDLCTELNEANTPPNVRLFAGILLSQAMEGEAAEDVQRGWETYGPEIQNHIKSQIMIALSSPENNARKSAALVIAKLAVVEFARGQWQELVPAILDKIARYENPQTCASALLCLKYLCEEVDEYMAPHTSNLIEAAKFCFSKQEEVLQMAVFDFLGATLELFRNEVQNPHHRNDIMSILCHAAGYPSPSNTKARALGFQSLGRMMGLYYDQMDDYITAIFNLTKSSIDKALKNEESEDVGQQAIEFWSITADAEAELLAQSDARPCRKFVERAVEGLVPTYLEFLKRQNDELDDETWTISRTAACSLETFARVAGPVVLPLVGTFMEGHIGRQDWRSKEAAMCAFGLCINENTSRLIKDPVQTLYGQFIPAFLRDNDAKIRRTTAWTLGKICKYVPNLIHENVAECLSLLGQAVNDVNAVAHYACWCIAQLADTFGGHANNPITQQARGIVEVLLIRSVRQDTSAKVVQSVHEAINNIIVGCNLSGELVIGFLIEFVNRLQTTMSSSMDSTLKAALLSGLYSSISITIQKCSKENQQISKDICDRLMQCSIQLIQQDSDMVYEEALLAFSALCENIKKHFVPYVMNDQLQQILARSIADAVHFPNLCRVGAGTIGDVYRYGEDEMKGQQLQGFTDKVVECLLHNMVSEDLDISVKCHVIDALADIGLCLGPAWTRYTAQVMQFCLQAACLPLPSHADEYLVEHFNDVRVSIVDVCRSTLMACLQSRDDLTAYHGLLADIFRFLEIVAMDTRCSDECTHQCVRYLTELIEARLLDGCTPPVAKIMKDIQRNGTKSSDPEFRSDAEKLGRKLSRGSRYSPAHASFGGFA